MADRKAKSQLREWVESILIALVIAVFIQTFIIQAFKIPSGSMIPTFKIGDRIFVYKFMYSARVPFINFRLPVLDILEPKRGDIIVFASPEEPKKDFVKRVVAFGGESVMIKDGKLFVDGKERDFHSSEGGIYYKNDGQYGGGGGPVTVPAGHYFTLGDNSFNSRDSRYWGFVPRKNLIGKAVFIYWPLYRMKVIK
jgi:signal peptidase I